ncbi:MAG: hypothetical protein C0469_15805 [Cyanobacteria bacterium DS2.3.42]|nr:hypothetical protein [Cyanobacteria bacterium DS2.3.42]
MSIAKAFEVETEAGKNPQKRWSLKIGPKATLIYTTMRATQIKPTMGAVLRPRCEETRKVLERIKVKKPAIELHLMAPVQKALSTVKHLS